jgi:D-isomer specific 2-hydroxyacid dehydrogenase, NAD binding domain
VNIARGGILDYDAVYQHLKTGHLGGLGIDVAWFEPFNPDDPILKLPNVLITPHVGGVTEYSYRTMAKVLLLFANFQKEITIVEMCVYCSHDALLSMWIFFIKNKSKDGHEWRSVVGFFFLKKIKGWNELFFCFGENLVLEKIYF